MYQLKGTQKGHELFFRILFNQVSETFYPRDKCCVYQMDNLILKKF